MNLPSPLTRATCPVHLHLLDLISGIFAEQYISWNSSLSSFLQYTGTSSLLGPNSPDSMGVSNVPVGYHVEPTLYALNVLWCAETFCRTSKVWRIYLGHIRLVLQPNYHITHSTYNIQIVPVRIAGSTEINTESINYGGGGGARWRSG